MAELSQAAKRVLAYHQTRGNDLDSAAPLVGHAPELPNDEALRDAYVELENAGLVECADEMARGVSDEGQRQAWSLFRLRTP